MLVVEQRRVFVVELERRTRRRRHVERRRRRRAERTSGDSREAASGKDDIVNALAAAMVAYREVVAVHGDTDSFITQLRIDPV